MATRREQKLVVNGESSKSDGFENLSGFGVYFLAGCGHSTLRREADKFVMSAPGSGACQSSDPPKFTRKPPSGFSLKLAEALRRREPV